MSFLYPAFLAGALAIAVPIVLHLLRRDVAPEVPFSAVRLLQNTPLEQTRRRRIRELLLLAARIAALILLAAAFARPYFTASAGEPPLLIVALDRSYSMGAPGRFDRALAQAREAIETEGRDGRVAVIAFDDRAEVAAAPGSAADARGSLTAIRPGFGATRYAPAIARAAELTGQSAARLIVVTDMQRAGWGGEEPVTVPAGLQIETRDAGAAASNAAVVGVRRAEGMVMASIRNGGRESVTGAARAVVSSRTAASAPFTVAPGATVDVPLRYQPPSRGSLAIEIDDPAGYAADNSRYTVLDPQQRPRVLIVGDGSQTGFYLTRALQAVEPQDVYDVRMRPARSLGAMPSQEFATHRAVVLLSTRSLDRRARDLLTTFVRGGGGLLVAAASDVDPALLGSIMEWPDFSAVEQVAGSAVLAATDLRHPIFRPFRVSAANLAQVQFTRAWRIRGSGWDVAARFTDGSPALLERREGQGRVIVFASDLDRRWNDFPLHPAFVPFTLETVRHITAAPAGRHDYVVANAPRGARPEPGIYTLPADGRTVAVNVDVRESATTTMSAEEFSGMVRRAAAAAAAAPLERRAQQAEERQGLWRYGLLLMLAALAAESMVGRTR